MSWFVDKNYSSYSNICSLLWINALILLILSFDAARQDPKCYVQEVAKEFDGRRTYSFFVGQMQGILSLLRQQRRGLNCEPDDI